MGRVHTILIRKFSRQGLESKRFALATITVVALKDDKTVGFKL
jgi:hypothetical protein